MAARVGRAPAPLSTLLSDPPHSLYEQAYRPRRQHAGNVNVDGTAVVWWPAGESEPLRYATDRPPWSDPNLLHLAPRLRGTAQLAAVRSGTPGLPYGPGAAAPFVHDGLAVAHNGRVDAIRGTVGRALLAELPDDLHGAVDVVTDSTILAATVAHQRRLHPEAGLAGALAATVLAVEKLCADLGHDATLTLLACDGTVVAGVRAALGEPSPTLFTAAEQPGAALAASEPLDDHPGWAEVPDRHVVELRPGGRTLMPLEGPPVNRPRGPARPKGPAAGHPSSWTGPAPAAVRALPSITQLAPPTDWREQLAADVRAGLTATPKSLPPKWFYDATGSELFERITELPEYYPTRTETAILREVADAVVELVRPDELVELGSGSSTKTRLLLEAMHRHGTGSRYAPLDISADALIGAGEALQASYPWLSVEGYVGDFTADLPKLPHRGRRLLAFLGSTIGNYTPAERAELLVSVAAALRPGDRFLLGVDLVKERATLEAAYDDAAGVTAEFNRNMLKVLARELDADVPVDAFEHVAFYDAEQAWIEMRLRATRPLTLRFPTLGLDVDFAAGEELHTEISSKFTRPVVEAELAAAGLRLERWDTDAGNRFALALACQES